MRFLCQRRKKNMSKADAHRHPQHIVDMKFYVGSLYVAVAQGHLGPGKRLLILRLTSFFLV